MGELADRIVARVARIASVLEAVGLTETDLVSLYALRFLGTDVSISEAAFLRVFAGREAVRVGCSFPRWEGEVDGVRFDASVFGRAKFPEGRTTVRLPASGMTETADLNPFSDVPHAEQEAPRG